MKKSELHRYVEEAEAAAIAACAAENPLTAWTHFIDLLDVSGRQKIGDDLERGGKNRYTGEPVIDLTEGK